MKKFFYAILIMGMLVSGVEAAVTASISPSGTLSRVSNVTVTHTYEFTGDVEEELKGLENFLVTFNGGDVTPTFLNAARLTVQGTTVTAEIEYLFAPGTYTYEVLIKLAGEEAVTAETTFTVPGDEQIRRKNAALGKVSLFMNQWNARDFGKWISLGNIDTFRDRLYEEKMQIYVDPGYLSDSDAVAAYVEVYIWKLIWTVYEEDLLINVEPEDFSNDGTNASATLWHELIHAVSHGLQQAGGSGQFSFNDDHLYIEWAESCIRGFRWLGSFEDFVAQNDRSNPSDEIAANGRQRWKKFLGDYNSTLYGRMPTEAEKAELSTMIGFDVDPEKIKAGYISMGYSEKYFDDITVRITSPADNAEISENQVEVSAEVTNNEPGLAIDKAGFRVNGAEQFSTLSGNTFTETAVLASGDNTLQAFVRTTDGTEYSSSPITVKSLAVNNTYHIRITWDKNETDVDVHFTWSGGSTCYWSNPSPTWNDAATSPRLDVDDTDGYGPENITIDALPGPGSYSIFVHYYSANDNGPTTVTASVFKDGLSIFSESKTLSDGENWTLLNFDL